MKDDGVCYLEGVDFTGLGLTGMAAFESCTHLTWLNLSRNSFTALSVEGCTALDTLWCERNYLDLDALETLAEEMGLSNVKIDPQLVDIPLDEEDEAALARLAEANGLPWEAELNAVNEALTWTLGEDGVYRLTGINLTKTTVSGAVDISGFRNLQTVTCAYRPVTEVILPGSLTELPENAFRNCR